MRLRALLWSRGHRYRLQYRTAAGRADIVFVRKQVAVFLDGCFWHGCPEHYVPPRSSRSFWSRKLRDNVTRDQRQTALLHEAGWLPLRFWEHELFESPERIVAWIEKALAGRRPSLGLQPRVVAVDFIDRDGKRERRCLQTLWPVRDFGVVIRERSTRKWSRKK